MNKLTFLIPVLILILGCSTNDTREQVSFEIIKKSHMSYSEVDVISKQYSVFKDRKQWLDFIPQIEKVHPSTAEQLKTQEFDFDNSQLAIIIGNYFTYCCNEITIEKVYKENQKIKIEFSESGLDDSIGFDALSQAYVLIRINAN